MASAFTHIFENFDKTLDSATIDLFRMSFEGSLKHREDDLVNELSSLTKDNYEDHPDINGYEMHLEDLIGEVYTVRKLGYELCVVALYKQIEIHCKKVVKHSGLYGDKQTLNMRELEKMLPFKFNVLPEFSAYEELRLLNNIIKHNGCVTAMLAKKLSSWKRDAELTDLDKSYDRLLPLVKLFVKGFALEIHKIAKTSNK
ncbi:MAG: hypothetical protein HQL65_07105 [Magnetococcales bacterium]|nr:hypothetical protein [Magnetococcales bacterium]